MLAMLRGMTSVDVHTFVQQRKEELFRSLVTCDPTHEQLLILKGRAVELNNFIAATKQKQGEKR